MLFPCSASPTAVGRPSSLSTFTYPRPKRRIRHRQPLLGPLPLLPTQLIPKSIPARFGRPFKPVRVSLLGRAPRQAAQGITIPPRQPGKIKLLALRCRNLHPRPLTLDLVPVHLPAVNPSHIALHKPNRLLLPLPPPSPRKHPLPPTLPDAISPSSTTHDAAEPDLPMVPVPPERPDQHHDHEPQHRRQPDVQRRPRRRLGPLRYVAARLGDRHHGALDGCRSHPEGREGCDGEGDVYSRRGGAVQEGGVDGPGVEGRCGEQVGRERRAGGLVGGVVVVGAGYFDGGVGGEEGRVPGYCREKRGEPMGKGSGWEKGKGLTVVCLSGVQRRAPEGQAERGVIPILVVAYRESTCSVGGGRCRVWYCACRGLQFALDGAGEHCRRHGIGRRGDDSRSTAYGRLHGRHRLWGAILAHCNPGVRCVRRWSL